MTLSHSERTKYEEIWKFGDYRKFSPGLENVERFMGLVNPKAGQSLYDVGCGEGKAGLEFARQGLRVTYVDITDAALDPAINRRAFIQAALWDDWAGEYHDFGFCCDVMEHIPPEYTMLVLERITTACGLAWFQICNAPDNLGRLIGQPLHLTVQPFTWWRDRLRDFGTVSEARDLCGNSLFVVQ